MCGDAGGKEGEKLFFSPFSFLRSSSEKKVFPFERGRGGRNGGLEKGRDLRESLEAKESAFLWRRESFLPFFSRESKIMLRRRRLFVCASAKSSFSATLKCVWREFLNTF